MSKKSDLERITEHTIALKNMVSELKTSFNTLNDGALSEEEHQCSEIENELNIIESRLIELFTSKESEV